MGSGFARVACYHFLPSGEWFVWGLYSLIEDEHGVWCCRVGDQEEYLTRM